MKAAGITLSTVGAGGGGAADFLKQLAEQGGGRYYPAANPASIPDIFLKETQQVSGQQIVEESFFPVQTGVVAHPARPGGRPAAAARLQRHDRQGRRRETILVTGRDDPLLAQWQYGLGPVRGLDVGRDRAAGRKDWVGWERLRPLLQPARALDVPGRGDRRHGGRVRDRRRRRRGCA